MKSNWTQKLRRIIKTTLRVFFLFLAFHWFLYFTKYENYYYYDTINGASSHAEVECGSQKKTLVEIDDSILEQLTKKCGYGVSAEYKEQRDRKFRELDQLQEDIARLKQSVYSQEELDQKQAQYQHDLKNFRDAIIKNIKHLKGQSVISDFDTRKWWEIILRDPTNFFLLRPLNWASQKLREHLWMEMLLKLAVIKLILLVVLYPFSFQEWGEKWVKYQQILDNQQVSLTKKKSVARKMPFLLIKFTINMAIFVYLIFRVLPSHPHFLDHLHNLFLRRVTFWGSIGVIFLRSFLVLGEELACRREMPASQSLKKYLLKIWLQNIFFNFLFFLFFSKLFLGESQGNSLLFSLFSLVDSLGNVLSCYVKPQKLVRSSLETK